MKRNFLIIFALLVILNISNGFLISHYRSRMIEQQNIIKNYQLLEKQLHTDNLIAKKVMYWPYIKKVSKELGLPAELVAVVQLKETGYLPFHKRVTCVSKAGAIGIHQVMPFHAANFGYKVEDLYNPYVNIKISCSLLKGYHTKYKGDLDKILAAYNGGPRQANKPNHLRCKETRNYVTSGKELFASLIQD